MGFGARSQCSPPDAAFLCSTICFPFAGRSARDLGGGLQGTDFHLAPPAGRRATTRIVRLSAEGDRTWQLACASDIACFVGGQVPRPPPPPPPNPPTSTPSTLPPGHAAEGIANATQHPPFFRPFFRPRRRRFLPVSPSVCL